MAFNIESFKSEGLIFGGARPSLFDVQITFPTNVNINDAVSVSRRLSLTCRAAQLPAATVGSIDVGYFGRMIKVAGDRTFADWTITVINDEDFLVRSAMEKWSNYINKLVANQRDGLGVETDYKANLTVKQYSKIGTIIRAYTVVGAFPTTIDAIDLNWETQNQIETFGVTFSYDYWRPAEGRELSNEYGNNSEETTVAT
jgi:hypothetical protein